MPDPDFNPAPPVAPSRNSPATFSADGDAFLAWMPAFRTQLIAMRDWVIAKVSEITGIKNLAAAYAQQPEDETVSGGSGFSALHYAAKTAADKSGTAADRVQTGLDRVQTGADVVSSGVYAAAAQAGAGLPAIVGKGGRVLTVKEDETGVEYAIRSNAEQVEITASGTWTKPEGVSFVMVEVWGGGSAGKNGQVGSSVDGNTGGRGGGYAKVLFNADDLAATHTVVIGAGGVAATLADTSTSNPGGVTTFANDGTALQKVTSNGGAYPGFWTGGAGGAGGTVGATSPAPGTNSSDGGGGGGGGGATASSGREGSVGGRRLVDQSQVAGAVPGFNANGATATKLGQGGGGGGGGTGAGGAGGSGGPAGGGGAGGSGTVSAGAGGSGGRGHCRVTSW